MIVTKRRDQANYVYKHLRYFAGKLFARRAGLSRSAPVASRVINLSPSTQRYIHHYIIYGKLSVELISCVPDEREFMKYIQQ